MASNSSYHVIAEQVINFNNNVVDLLSKINQLITGTDPSVTVNIVDQSGIAGQFTLPSFGFLKSEIDRLNNNINSIYSINEAGALIQPSNGTKFKKIVTVDLNIEPNDVGNMPVLSKFKAKKNWFFDKLLNPELFVELDLSGQIEDNVRKILSRRYIASFAQDTNGNLTPLGQSALNSFNSLYRNKNGFTLDEYVAWYQTTPGLVNPQDPNYDEQQFDLEPNQLLFDGAFTVISITEDVLNKKLWYNINTLTYIKNIFTNGVTTKQTNQLSVNDELIINTPQSSTRYSVVEINTSASNPAIRLNRIEGNEPIPVGVDTLKIYSPVVYNKTVQVNVGYNERNVIFIKALDMNNYILSKNWSKGLGFWTNDLKDVDSGLSMEQYYIDNVYDYGNVIHDLVSKKIPVSMAGVPNAPVLDVNNFKVVQTNTHLTDTPNSNVLKTKHEQQKTLQSETQQINNAIQEKNKQIKITQFTSAAAKKQFQNEIETLNKNKVSKTSLLSSITSDILDLSKSPITQTKPKFSVRGFWTIPDPTITTGTKPQQIVQFRVQYRYLSADGKETPVQTFKLNDSTAATKQTAAFSNWNEIKTDSLKQVRDAVTGDYYWASSDITNPDVPNINQIDIPIQYNEQVELRISSISEVGWPDSPVESTYSNSVFITFPTDLNNVLNNNDAIIKEADKQDLKISIQSDLTAKGLDEHLSQQITINDKTFYHDSSGIISGFKDSNGVSIDMFTFIGSLLQRIQALEEKINNINGILDVIIYNNNEMFTIKNGSEIAFNIECEDYLESYVGINVPTGRVYSNNIYTIKDFVLKISNGAVNSPLGLLSNRLYNSTTNSDVYNSSTPQVFWVDEQDNLITSDVSGTSKSQIDNQYLWMMNYDNVNNTTVTKLSDNVGNNFINDASNSITSVLSSSEYNVGYSEVGVLTFIGNNKTLIDPSKWIDKNVSVSSTTKLLTTIHPVVNGLSYIQELNSDKVHALNSGKVNDIIVPINIYFKMNALDTSQSGPNTQYINLNSVKSTVKHVKKIKFLLDNQADNKPFTFTVKFTINRARIVMKKTISSTPIQLINNK